jgi:hypothetical protein
VEDCDGPLDLVIDTVICGDGTEIAIPEGAVTVTCPDGTIWIPAKMILEVNMWANAKLKTAIDQDDTYFALADNIGFNQVMMNDIIIMDQVRLPEHMLVTGFDERNHLIRVQRGYNGTQAQAWAKGTGMKIFRVLNAPGTIELIDQDVTQPDGSTDTILTDTLLVYEWNPEDTCLPGCYWLEFKLLKEEQVQVTSPQMAMLSHHDVSITPSFTPSTMSASDFGCSMGAGIEWVRRFPVAKQGFLIQVIPSPTTEI